MKAPIEYFKVYRRKEVTTMRPYFPGEDMTDVSVGPQDVLEEGGMIALREGHPGDKWYVPKALFDEQYEEVL